MYVYAYDCIGTAVSKQLELLLGVTALSFALNTGSSKIAN